MVIGPRDIHPQALIALGRLARKYGVAGEWELREEAWGLGRDLRPGAKRLPGAAWGESVGRGGLGLRVRPGPGAWGEEVVARPGG